MTGGSAPGGDGGPARGPGRGHARRYAALALLAGLWLVPGIAPWALGAGAAALLAGGALAGLRRRRVRSEERAAHGVSLGVDPRGRPVTVTDHQLAAHGLIVGASGAGKSTTLLRILCDQIARGRPVVAIDMKGSPAFTERLREAAAAAGRGLLVWSPDGPGHWNPLAHGNATALKDRLILTERFSEPHYQRAAERYVQTALQVLHAAHPDRAARLDEVVAALEPRRLAGMLRGLPEPLTERVQDYLATLTVDQLSAVRGLGTRLALLTESSAGPYLSDAGTAGATVIDVGRALQGDNVVVFSLNSSVYGQLAAQLGALAIQDLTSAAGRRLDAAGAARHGLGQATVAIDEFSALGGDNVLSLLARGREAGVSVLLATQELSDLERAGAGFRDQVLGVTAVKIAHRQDVPSSAHTIALMAGTERVWEYSEQLLPVFSRSGASRGSRRQVEQFLVHPNEIKTLRTGHAVVLTKTPAARVARLRVTAPSAIGSGPGMVRSADRGGDQPAPGVTR